MEHRLVKDWMTRDPITVSPWTALIDAYKLMKDYEIRRLPVVYNGRLVGIITLSDIRSTVPGTSFDPLLGSTRLANLPVSDLMTKDPVTIQADACVAEAARVMYEYKFGGLPVVQGEQLVGIISESDLFRIVMIEAEEESA